jgi:hypothetical protein
MAAMIKTVLHNYATGTGKIWATDRSQTVGASEVGQCARKVFWSKNEGDPKYGAPRDPDYVDGWGARVRGTVMEDQFWFPAMKQAFGDRLLFAGPDQQTFVSGFISATPDGLITHLLDGEHPTLPAGTCVTAECKTADPRTNLTEAKSENIYQTHIQMGLIRERGDWKPTHSILSYTDASFWNEVVEFVVPFDQHVFDTGRDRAAKIMTATTADELKPEGWIAGGRECEYCPFTKACGIKRRSVPDDNAAPDPQFVAECADLAIAIKTLEGKRDDADVQMRELQDELKARLRDHGVRKIPGVLSWSHVKGRQSYNNKAIQAAAIAAGIDIEQFSTVGEPTDRLTVSVSSDTESQAAKAA